MKKIILILIIVVLSQCHSDIGRLNNYDSLEKVAKKQIKESSKNILDSLAKYSYRLDIWEGGKSSYTATCFFVRREKKLFLVSNAHVLCGINTATGEFSDIKVDSIRIVQNIDGKLYYQRITYNKNHIKPFYYYDKPDLSIQEIKTHKGYKINSIERFLSDEIPVPNIEPDNIVSFGFAINRSSPDNPKIETFKMRDPLNKIDTVIFFGKKVAFSACYIVYPVSNPGMSGSPVFLIYNNKVCFGGIISTELERRFEAIVRPSFLLKSFIK